MCVFAVRPLICLLLDLCVCAVLCAQVSKLYRFQTEDQRWMLVREQMSETPLSFSLPKQLLSALINEHQDRYALSAMYCVPQCGASLSSVAGSSTNSKCQVSGGAAQRDHCDCQKTERTDEIT